LDAWVCRTFGALPTEERFQRLELEQKEALFHLCSRLTSEEGLREALWKQDQGEEQKAREKEAVGKGKFRLDETLVQRMVDELVSKGLPLNEAKRIAENRADFFLANVEKGDDG